mmetsp:Transcript_33232/g.94513  ORF Transcript_33232/g.94513 Transcript_33232/m.94513 type:complete len:219 (+) Transcript_33232:487-1143(+)
MRLPKLVQGAARGRVPDHRSRELVVRDHLVAAGEDPRHGDCRHAAWKPADNVAAGGVPHRRPTMPPPCQHPISPREHLDAPHARVEELGEQLPRLGVPDEAHALLAASNHPVALGEDLGALHLPPVLEDVHRLARGRVPYPRRRVAAPRQGPVAQWEELHAGDLRGVAAEHAAGASRPPNRHDLLPHAAGCDLEAEPYEVKDMPDDIPRQDLAHLVHR